MTSQGILLRISLMVLVFMLSVAGAAAQTSGETQSQQAEKRIVVEQESPPEAPRSPREMAEIRASLFMLRKQFAEATEVYKELLKSEPRNARLLNLLGMAYLNLSNIEQAKKYFERAIKADKQFADAVNNLGAVWYQRKNYRRAIRYYKQAIDLRPETATFHCNLGYAYFHDKKFDLALASIQRAMGLDPQVLERRGSSGGSLLQDRTVEERGYFFFFVAKSYALLGNAERCTHYLRRAHDEGYKHLALVEKDPAFERMIKEPMVLEYLNSIGIALPPKPSA
jgi:tetratricopeptide (TPR) repeat protein